MGALDGPRGGIWTVQAPSKTRDVYITNLAIADFQKVSLHQSGDWRYAWQSAYAKQLGLSGPGRILTQRARPSATVPGWTEALQIWVLHDELSIYEGIPTPADPYFKNSCQTNNEILWIPDPGPGKAVGLYLMLGEPDGPELGFPGYLPIAGMELAPDGKTHEACIVFLVVRDLSDQDYALVNDAKAKMPETQAFKELDLTKPSIRGFLFGTGLRGVPSFWDIRPVTTADTE